ncbi:DUF4389 domain-containing protein [Gammaproteobacteria bacterium]|jgi:hypothetical protein|nr:DUF4389 domain-containing protein [Gammaproteobacteria bacterium]MDA7829700.1 DUF4389 domain-containing protein [Gammaproteobacteria bacterium]MDA7843965.1 DUF4389 domain-containing protein [Gammaproteobacteria bacterium]MDA8955465.1 DUF4389 domain-containing protein [Gammaproteobacteria bacterium]MDA9040040.1 DUF4389 domain-containing protein [Gammaproteobacteria bacterium]|tara:strand:- start:378 stop:776 length:399 start_codon:yes stop_codon:yes gene_type:complete
MEINREEVKEEVLKIGKWTRFLFMLLYAFALNFVISVSIGLAFIQFIFVLFTAKVNEALSDFNKHLYLFVSDTLKFLLFDTEDKPFPFKKSSEEEGEVIEVEVETDSKDVEEVFVEEVEVTLESPDSKESDK